MLSSYDFTNENDLSSSRNIMSQSSLNILIFDVDAKVTDLDNSQLRIQGDHLQSPAHRRVRMNLLVLLSAIVFHKIRNSSNE